MPSLVEQSAIRKVYWRLLPLAILTYFLCYLDRINVGFAALTMNKDLGLDAATYGRRQRKSLLACLRSRAAEKSLIYCGQTGACLPSGTAGRAHRGGVCAMTAAWRTAVSRPNPDGVSSRQSRTSSNPGSRHVVPSMRPS